MINVFLGSLLTLYFIAWLLLIVVALIRFFDVIEVNEQFQKEKCALFLLMSIFPGPILLLVFLPHAIMLMVSACLILLNKEKTFKEIFKNVL